MSEPPRNSKIKAKLIIRCKYRQWEQRSETREDYSRGSWEPESIYMIKAAQVRCVTSGISTQLPGPSPQTSCNNTKFLTFGSKHANTLSVTRTDANPEQKAANLRAVLRIFSERWKSEIDEHYKSMFVGWRIK